MVAPITKAKRGDFFAYLVIHSASYAHGPSERYTEWAIGIATSIARDGSVSKFRRPGEKYVSTAPSERALIPAATLRASYLEAALIARDYPNFETKEQIKDFVRPFLL